MCLAGGIGGGVGYVATVDGAVAVRPSLVGGVRDGLAANNVVVEEHEGVSITSAIATNEGLCVFLGVGYSVAPAFHGRCTLLYADGALWLIYQSDKTAYPSASGGAQVACGQTVLESGTAFQCASEEAAHLTACLHATVNHTVGKGTSVAIASQQSHVVVTIYAATCIHILEFGVLCRTNKTYVVALIVCVDAIVDKGNIAQHGTFGLGNDAYVFLAFFLCKRGIAYHVSLTVD